MQIDTFGENDNGVIVTWSERNATSNEPLIRTSTDNGATFGPVMKLSANETIVVSGGYYSILFVTNITITAKIKSYDK